MCNSELSISGALMSSIFLRPGRVLAALGMAFGLLFSGTSALAQAPANAERGSTELALKKVIEQRLTIPRVDAVVKLPYSGLYEVRIGNDIIYTDAKGDFVFVGNIIDTRTLENKTRARVDALVQAASPQFKFADLPFDSAIQYVKGNGKRQIAVFADPNCTFCKRFEKSLQQLSDVTIHVFLYPVLGPDSVEKSKSIWCSPDRGKAWLDWMLNGTLPTAAGTCAHPVETLTALGRSLNINGTPTTLFANGRRAAGAIPMSDLQKIMAQPPA